MHRRASFAFTLVELLVVIGIIGVLVAILLPTLSSARDRASSVKCLANLKQMGNAIAGYAAENRGQVPWGDVWDAWDPKGAEALPGVTSVRYNTWTSILSGYMDRKRKEGNSAGVWGGARFGNVSGVFRCPSVSDDFKQPVTYTPLLTAMVDWIVEAGTSYNWSTNGGGPGLPPKDVIRPARTTDFYSDNILVWESTAWRTVQSTDLWNGGIGPCFSYFDGGQLLYPQASKLRYRTTPDEFGNDSALGQSYPIYLPTRKTYSNVNKDAAGSSIQIGQAGALRFRHNKELGANVLFADGSARTMSWSPSQQSKFDTTSAPTDILRRMIMIKTPTGVAGNINVMP